MKRIVSLLLVTILCLSLSACGGKSLEEATADADALLAEWTDMNYNGFYYLPMDSNPGHYNVILLDHSNGENFSLQKSLVDICAKELYKELSKCFRGHDIKFGAIVAKDADNILFVYTHEDLAALK